MSPRSVVAATSAGIALVLLLAGCASAPGGGDGAPDATPTPPADTASPGPDDHDDLEAVLLDDGRMFAIVSWGSSSCIPTVGEVAADGQTIAVTLTDPGADIVCTADYAPRASVGGLPEGVDPTQDLTLQVTYGDLEDDVDLDGWADATGTPGEASADPQPSAAWFDDDALVLLTWGSSTCPPVIDSVESSGDAGTVTFSDDTQVPCTMDLAPRGTVVSFDDDRIDDDQPFTLTLVGGGLDGTVEVH